MPAETVILNGVVRGRTIELENGAPLPDGAHVRITVTPTTAPAVTDEIERLCAELRSGKPLRDIWPEIERDRADERRESVATPVFLSASSNRSPRRSDIGAECRTARTS